MPGALPTSRVGDAADDPSTTRVPLLAPTEESTMSYWSLRRAAERATAGHELARTNDETLAPASRSTVRLPDWTPVSNELHPATVTSVASASRTLRQRASDLGQSVEKTLWTLPEQAEQDPRQPSAMRPRVPASW